MKYPLEDVVCFFCVYVSVKSAQRFVLCAALALMALCYYETRWCCHGGDTYIKCVCVFLSSVLTKVIAFRSARASLTHS